MHDKAHRLVFYNLSEEFNETLSVSVIAAKIDLLDGVLMS